MKSIIYGDNLVTLADSLYITVVSMFIVFAILVIISFSLYLLQIVAKIGGKEETVKKVFTEKVEKKIEGAKVVEKIKKYQFENLKDRLDDEGVRLAIMTSCIHASEEFGHENIRINYVREV